MKRVLVADDEILVRIGVRTLLEGSEYEVSAEAAGGVEALRLCESVRPDVVLTDLVMADGGGLDLIRSLRDPCRGRDEAIIVLSSHDDFDLVREAMRAGADDYVLKLTLKSGDLIEALGRSLEKHTEGRSRSIPGPVPNPGVHGSELDAAADAWTGREWILHPYRVLLLDFGTVPGNAPAEAALSQLVRELVRVDPAGLDAVATGHRAVIAYKNAGRTAARASFALAGEFGHRYLGRRPRGGLSSLGSGVEDLKRLLNEAGQAADEAFRRDGFFAFEENGGALGNRGFGLEAFAEACASIRRFIEALDEAAVLECSLTALSLLRDTGDRDADRLRALAADLFAPYKERARGLGFDLDGTQDLVSVDQVVGSARDLGELETFFRSFVPEFIRKARAQSGISPQIAETRRWALANLARQISVEDAAEHAIMSPSHFAHTWKREIGASFLQFMNEVRLNRARELLLTTDLLVREIASAVGFESLNHFGNIFKRRFRLSPNDLRVGRESGTA